MGKTFKSNIAKILLLIIILYSVSLSILLFKNYQSLNLSEPQFGTYRSDEMIFLKTYYLVKSGHNYYDSFPKAAANDYANIKLDPDIFTWRLPTVFYFWQLAQNGYQILTLYWTLTILFFISIYLIIKKLYNSNTGLLAVVLVLPYFAGNLSYKTSFLFVEWWALFFFTFGLTFFFYKKLPVAWVLLLLALATRELMTIPIFSLLILSVLLKKNRIFFIALILFSLIIFAIHSHVVLSRFLDVQQTSTIFSRLHAPDKQSFLTMISFSMQNYPLTKYRVNLLLIVLAFVSLVINIKKKGDKGIYYFLAPWSIFLTFPFITSSFYNDYWGILFMPLLISTIPVVWKIKT